MSRATLMVLGAIPLVGLTVYAAGAGMVPGGRRGVLAGVLIGCGLQLLLLLVARTVFPEKPLAAYGLGMLVRLIVVVAAALVLVPASGLPAGPMLLSLVSVLFATTLLEPLALAGGRRTKS